MRIIDDTAYNSSLAIGTLTKYVRRGGYHYLFYANDTGLVYRYGETLAELRSCNEIEILTNDDTAKGYKYDVKYNSIEDIIGIVFRRDATGRYYFVYFEFDETDNSLLASTEHDIAGAAYAVGAYNGLAMGVTTSGRWAVAIKYFSGGNNNIRFFSCGRKKPTATAHWINNGLTLAQSACMNMVLSGIGAGSNNQILIVERRTGDDRLASWRWDGAVMGAQVVEADDLDMDKTYTALSLFLPTEAGTTFCPISPAILDSSGNVHVVIRGRLNGAERGLFECTYDANSDTWGYVRIGDDDSNDNNSEAALAICKDDDNNDIYLVAGEDGILLRFYKKQSDNWYDLTNRLTGLDFIRTNTVVNTVLLSEAGNASSGGSSLVVIWNDIAGANEVWADEIRTLFCKFTASPTSGNAPLKVRFRDTSESFDLQV